MEQTLHLTQEPAPGNRLVRFCGDTINFKLQLNVARNGTAWIRTNLGQSKIVRREIIRQVDAGESPLGRAWFDIPMRRVDSLTFEARLPLYETGHFEAKCFFIPHDEKTPLWPRGSNTVLNVDAADSSCGNIIYNAFVRQFGSNKAVSATLTDAQKTLVEQLDQQGYAVIPPSGTFRDLIAELDFILGDLGCRILMLLPIHPTPTTYGRMGRFGSPYAALSFTAVDPALAEFDHHATPLEQFIELVDEVHGRNARIIIDIAINHTGWAAGLHESHPRWLVRGPQGKIEIPGAWGVDWEDLTKLDYSHQDLWQYMAEVFLTWCKRGVDGFRCDAGYMIPAAAWKYIVARVRDQFPDTVFLLEGLGGKISVTRDLLNSANLNWAYSELFQNYDRSQVENYLPEAFEISASDGLAVHFAETHDNLRLASRSPVYARMRTALCALCSQRGAFGFANGVEWYATEKINVHNAPSLNWGAETNQVDQIRRLNDLLKRHPAFLGNTELKMIQHEGQGNYICLSRRHIPTGKRLLVVANLDDKNPTTARWRLPPGESEAGGFVDLLTGAPAAVSEPEGGAHIFLDPAQVMCLSRNHEDLDLLQPSPDLSCGLPRQIEIQRLRAKVLDARSHYRGTEDLADFDIDQAARRLKEHPLGFLQELNPDGVETRVITWAWPRDRNREVMIPPGHFIHVKAEYSFRIRLVVDQSTVAAESSFEHTDGSFFALFKPIDPPATAQSAQLILSLAASDGGRHEEAHLLLLPRPAAIEISQAYPQSTLIGQNRTFLATNGRGAMLRVPLRWGELKSRYDCLLAANMSRRFPEDRWVMFSRCRSWLVYQGYSQELNTDCLEKFETDDNGGGYWHFHVPTGQGENIRLTIGLRMAMEENAVQMRLYRHPAQDSGHHLEDGKAVTLILRPDIENRSFHDTTKAYTGPENDWPGSVSSVPQGFEFAPDERHLLQISLTDGKFVPEPEWQYMIHRSMDAERGQDPDSDLFSPGYFSVSVQGNQQVFLTAGVKNPEADHRVPAFSVDPATAPSLGRAHQTRSLQEMLTRALDNFVVQRGEHQSVIAGYPWFLDWGRDALIFARGLIAARRFTSARAVLEQFGQFEQHGTLPNMIRGDRADNRDTSDAPLWLILACEELVSAEDSPGFLEINCAGRSMRDIILSIVNGFMAGTPNGIKMDPESGLVFSPVHFTWMDTNHPAGTPRQGFPIEIQALWYAALLFLSRVDQVEKRQQWKQLSETVRSSITDLFWQSHLGYLSDCLHCSADQTAMQATPDDALRPNQLLAITLGAIDDDRLCRRILTACQTLLVPGAIRSLADSPVTHPIEVMHRGQPMNDPYHPYRGTYIGDEDTQRKPAYHNGTAWTWPFPSFCEAWTQTYGRESRQTAQAWLASSLELLTRGCVGHIPEILDGDFPHTQRGCDAQAWGASEFLRVWIKLQGK